MNKHAYKKLADDIRENAIDENGDSIRPYLILQLTHSGRYSKPTGKAEPMIVYHSPVLDPTHNLKADYPLITDKYLDELEGKFIVAAKLYSTANYGCNVGIIGAGMIGSLVINMLKGYYLKVLVFDPYLSDKKAAELDVQKCSLEYLFENSSTISNHLANNPQTVGMLNKNLFDLMSDNATFINTARGAQVVEIDLVQALTEKPDRTALLDVTFPEPSDAGHPFLRMNNVFLTPHIAGSKNDEVKRMADYMINEYQRYIAGESTRFEVTMEMLNTMA